MKKTIVNKLIDWVIKLTISPDSVGGETMTNGNPSSKPKDDNELHVTIHSFKSFCPSAPTPSLQ